METVVLLSGGKDSVYSAYIAQQQFYNVQATLTIIPSSQESYMFHVPNSHLAPVISSAIGLPNYMIEVEEGEEELDALSREVKKLGYDSLITGALASDYQALRINLTCEPLGVKVFSPLWHKDQESILREMVEAGFKIVMVGTSAERLDEAWLGRPIDIHAINDLKRISAKRKIQIGGEGGEFETFVLDGPNFNKSLEIASSRKFQKRDSGLLKIDAIRLKNKN